MTDGEILALRDGGRAEEAFRCIVAGYSKPLYYHIRSMVLSHEDADDLLQETFVKVWNSFGSFRGDSKLATWLWKIATNETLSFLRKMKVRSALRFRPVTEELERRIDEDPYFDGDEAEKRLLKALQSLPQRQRMVFSMKYFEDMRYEDMAQVLGVSVGALKASYHIASEKLKEIMLNF